MKILIKTLKGEQFPLEVEADLKVRVPPSTPGSRLSTSPSEKLQCKFDHASESQPNPWRPMRACPG